MVDAMVALAATDDDEDADFLTKVCVDAENAYEVCTAVVQAVADTDGVALLDLKRAYETEGGAALRRRVANARPRVREISERTRSEELLAEHR